MVKVSVVSDVIVVVYVVVIAVAIIVNRISIRMEIPIRSLILSILKVIEPINIMVSFKSTMRLRIILISMMQ
jgi:hypothetical protein